MAEFPQLGQQCSQCKTLDFLPLICDKCKQVYCKEHHSFVAHNCPQSDKQWTPTPVSRPSESISGKCCFCNQSVLKTELVLCDKCHEKHCLSHRHYESHECKHNKTDQKPAQPLRKPLLNASAPNVKGPKNEGLARRVALMKLKQKASGQSSIPMSERLFFKLSYQKSSQLNEFESKDIFLSTEWSVGKCVDWLSTHLSVINNNNNPTQPKLVLTSDGETSEPFPMSSSLKQLESDELIQSGDNLCLKYIQ
ncbi:unnamed protein product [Oppiella nova]|uniref:AN1-type domain-containing protein n=1 Tax=Oppiella nova TaxID=334625 RepID=A0A7R9MLJ3_9ACAR|nr:unnamed protein product [Oppiella nova]CAG2179644.1 unnamed protein product [Oppiella nova]